jgi:hypothetical protein
MVSYLAQPYYGSNRSVRVFTSVSAATKKLGRRVGKIYNLKIMGKNTYVVKIKGKKYYEK